MGFVDDVRNKAGELANEHGDKIDDGIERAAELVDDTTGRKHTGKVDKVKGKAHEAVDKLKQ